VTTLHAEAANRDYRIWVALPAGYNPEATDTRTYPVVCLLDGNWTFPMVTEVFRMMVPGEEIGPTIVVRIGYPTDDLDVHISRLAWDLRPEEIGGDEGGAAKFLAFIQDQVIPHIESTYGADPADRTVAGSRWEVSFPVLRSFTPLIPFSATSPPAPRWRTVRGSPLITRRRTPLNTRIYRCVSSCRSGREK
jgi:hypothetical protein